MKNLYEVGETVISNGIEFIIKDVAYINEDNSYLYFVVRKDCEDEFDEQPYKSRALGGYIYERELKPYKSEG